MEFNEQIKVTFKVNGESKSVSFTNHDVQDIGDNIWVALFRIDGMYAHVCGTFTENEFLYESLDHDVTVHCMLPDDDGECKVIPVSDVVVEPVI